MRTRLGFEAVITGVLLEIAEDRQAVLLLTGLDFIDVIVEPVGEDGRLRTDRVRLIFGKGFEPPALFGLEARVADLESLSRDVRAIRQQLLG